MSGPSRGTVVFDALLVGVACGLSALLAEIVGLSVLDPAYRRVLAYDVLVLELAGAYAALFGLLGLVVGAAVAAAGRRLERPREAARLVLLGAALVPVIASALAFRPALRALLSGPLGALALLVALGAASVALFALYRRGRRAVRTRALPLLAVVFTLASGADAFVLQHLLNELADPATLARALLAGALMMLAAGPLVFALTRAPELGPARGAAPATLLLTLLIALVVFVHPPTRSGEPPRARAADSPPSILLVVIDTLRADHVTKELMPRLTAFGESAQRFEHAMAAAPWTTPSFGSLLSSQYPAEHRAGTAGAGGGQARMRAGVESLPEVLRERGYFTHAVLTNPYVNARYGLHQGFERYENLLGINTYHPIAFWLSARSLLPHRTHYLRAEIQARRIRRALDEAAQRARPSFVLAHFMDPHWPYRAPAEHGGRPAATRAEGYAAECRYVDDVLGALLDELERSGRLAHTAVVVTSDHGEEIDELRLGEWKDHGHTLHEELLHVPLFVRRPGGEAGPVVRRDLVSHIDLAPTLLGLVGHPAPPAWRGLDLLRAETPALTGTRAVLAEALLVGPEQKAARRGARKVIAPAEHLDRVHARLFDLAQDPLEERADSVVPDSEGFTLLRLLRAHHELTGGGGDGEDAGVAMDPVLEEQLRSLGYVD